MVSLAPADELDVEPMLRWALQQKGPVSIRYPKANLERIDRAGDPSPVELGKAELLDWGEDGCFVAFGSMTTACVAAARRLRGEGVHVGVISARFVKPLDKDLILRAVQQLPLVVTVEEGTLEGGFGSAVLEAANAAGLNTGHVIRRGIPDRFIEHGERGELLADLGLDAAGLAATVRQARAAESGLVGVG
jgi:1-deoxy-D-xylulose-5-phosphate synthase